MKISMRIETKKKSPANRSTRGYSFTEVLFSTVIVGFTAVSLYSAFAFGFAIVQATRQDLRATQILVQKVESIRLLTWDQLMDTNHYLLPTFSDVYDPLGASNKCAGTTYKGTVSSTIPADGSLPDTYRTNMRTVTVTLS